uniref:M-zodatoxin-Lt5a n=1 Tax=Lachesana tarabaevi TaxID=379576 RepID=LAT5_LACTA|nr:RecName: Full=M-zodatoxin-Lt5a; Short=M-ZDTX-Lt5a; AltName: Full=Latarcin-5; Short=Ltc-5; Flags: Precursor [Lachesana tarabaevi]CAJ81650.1 latarcin 5 precursor, pLtc 5 [Lachesana tarabaevi]
MKYCVVILALLVALVCITESRSTETGYAVAETLEDNDLDELQAYLEEIAEASEMEDFSNIEEARGFFGKMKEYFKKFGASFKRRFANLKKRLG